MKFRLAVFLFFRLLVVPLAQAKGSPDQFVSSIGLQTGQKAPAFTALDQFGREQSNQTLKGSGGTVLLFFRSADW